MYVRYEDIISIKEELTGGKNVLEKMNKSFHTKSNK